MHAKIDIFYLHTKLIDVLNIQQKVKKEMDNKNYDALAELDARIDDQCNAIAYIEDMINNHEIKKVIFSADDYARYLVF